MIKITAAFGNARQSTGVLHTALLTIILLAALFVLSGKAAAADMVNGKNLYMVHCAGCHGDKGVSFMKQAPNLARSGSLAQADPVLIDKILAGKNAMPPFFGILNDRQIRDIIVYARSLM
ncbi:MAG: cytochrome c [Candidatus Nitrotoga sp.]